MSVHRAVLASCSPFMSNILLERDETFLILPDVRKDDFMALVHLIYNDSSQLAFEASAMPSKDLVKLLGMDPQIFCQSRASVWNLDDVVQTLDDDRETRVKLRASPEHVKVDDVTTNVRLKQVFVETEKTKKLKNKKVSSETDESETETTPNGIFSFFIIIFYISHLPIFQILSISFPFLGRSGLFFFIFVFSDKSETTLNDFYQHQLENTRTQIQCILYLKVRTKNDGNIPESLNIPFQTG